MVDDGDFSKRQYILLGIAAIIIGILITYYSSILASLAQPGYVIGNGILFVASYLLGPIIIVTGILSIHSGVKKEDKKGKKVQT